MSARFVTAALVASLGMSTGATASAQVSSEACASAYARGQEDRLAGRLFAARTAFQQCAADTCPQPSARDCQRWVREVEADLPTARIRVHDAQGKDIAGLAVSADGVTLSASALAGAVILEAGPHQLRVEAPGYAAQTVETALRPTDRELPVEIVLHPIGEPTAKPNLDAPARPVPALAVAFAGVGVLALGSSLYFGLRAHSQYQALKESCAPRCSDSDAHSVHRKALAADVSLLVSAAALGAATWLYLSRGPAHA